MDKNTYIYNKRDEGGDAISYYKVNGVRKSFFDMEYLSKAASMYPYYCEGPHTHDFYVIYCFFERGGIASFDFQDHPLAPNTIVFMPPSRVSSYNGNTDVDGFIITFSDDFINMFSEGMRKFFREELFSPYKESSILCMDNNAAEGAKWILQTLYGACTENPNAFGRDDCLSSLLCIFIIHLYRYVACSKEERQTLYTDSNPVYYSFLASLGANYRSIHSVKGYAEALNVSVGRLNKCVRNAVGSSPIKLIETRIVLEAKHLLDFSHSMKVKEIAFQLGFCDTSHFAKFFKRNCGVSPSAYRNKNNAKR